jgi:hypothetical protein
MTAPLCFLQLAPGCVMVKNVVNTSGTDLRRFLLSEAEASMSLSAIAGGVAWPLSCDVI